MKFASISHIKVTDLETHLNGLMFDVSEANGGEPFDTLSDALAYADSVLLPEQKKGGMTIKYVQSSDNKYMQFICKTENFSVEPEDWAICADEMLVENTKYNTVFLDKDNKIIIGVLKDGDIIFGIGIPKEIAIALNHKVDKEVNKSLINKFFADSVLYLNKNDIIEAYTDKDSKMYQFVTKDGAVNIPFLNADKIHTVFADFLEFEDSVKFGKVLFGDVLNIDYLSDAVFRITETTQDKKVISGTTKRGEIYIYNLVSPVIDNIKEDISYIKTHSPIQTTARFLQISDIHFDNTRVGRQNGVNNSERMELLEGIVNEQMKTDGVNFVVCTGDNCVAEYISGERDNNLALFKEAVVDNIDVPFFPVVGNHDAYTDEEWFDVFKKPKQYSVELNSKYYIIVLDVYHGSADWGHRNDTWEVVSGDVMVEQHLSGTRDFRFTTVDNVYLEKQLKIARNLNKKPIVCLHTLDYSGSVDETAAATSVNVCKKLIKAYGGNLVLNGHSHVVSNVTTDSINYCNPGWFGCINDYNHATSPWGINIFQNIDGYFTVSSVILAHNYIDTPRLGNVEGSVTTKNLWKEEEKRATYFI